MSEFTLSPNLAQKIYLRKEFCNWKEKEEEEVDCLQSSSLFQHKRFL